MDTIDKDPGAELDYGRTWEHWLEPGEVIAASTWAITAASSGPDEDPVIQDPAKPPAGWIGPITFVWLIGGTAGRYYRVVNRITTGAGRTDQRTFQIKVTAR